MLFKAKVKYLFKKAQLRSTPKTAVIVAIHLAALQQFCGINAVIAYGG